MDALCIAGLLAHHARYQPEAVAVVFGEQRLNWREFAARCGQLAQAMAQAGVQPGDRVATVLGNCMELLTIYWACADMGAVAVPLSPLLQCSGLQSLLQDAAPKIVFASEATQADVSAAIAALSVPVQLVCVAAAPAPYSYAAFVAGCAPIQQRLQLTPEHPCNIMYTSGTTGQPKGILLTHRVRAHYAALMASIFRMTPESVVLHTGAIVFNGAYVMMMPAFAQGARYVLHGAFDARAFVATVAREKVTHTMLVPSQIAAILDLPDLDPLQLVSLQVVLSLGAPLPLARKQALESLLPGRLHELYGLTEGFITVLDRRDTARKLGSVGVPPPFFELRIVREDGSDAEVGEVGEIAGRGPLLMSGYYGQPELTAQTILSAVALVSSFPRNAAGKILKRELRAPYWEGRTLVLRRSVAMMVAASAISGLAAGQALAAAAASADTAAAAAADVAADPAAAPAANEPDKVIVTARRRAELIQDVPGSVTAISGTALEKSGIPDLTGLADALPNTTLKPS
eukprot:gene13715-13497_t